MYKLLLMTLMLVIWMLLQALQLDEEMAIQTLFHGKYAVNRAAHAAAQQLDMALLSKGEVRIDEAEAAEQAASYLRYNLRLDDRGEPLHDSLLRSSAEVLVFDVINGNEAFPYLYRSVEHNYEVVLQGPSVVMIVRMDYQRAFSVLEPIQWEIKGAAELVRS
ncbi:hypothetical protein [Paenibacillus abyssi]|uniref:Uncharacterized protein n=2 Tax=Paenibacillus abyssi TaxID=1340531 RepID=A0A917FU67_9BACL|nr:hypothetical protein [Paenibacillus abyssi]GGG09203.1 hypothetical protein GCM10010916_27580 [Paenibacillus abyssi]